MKTLPWTVKQTGPNSADDDFIMRQIKGADGKNVALVTTGDYTDEVEAEHAAFIARAANAYNVMVAALRDIAQGNISGRPGAPDPTNEAYRENPLQFYGDMWEWSQVLARAALSKTGGEG